MAWTAPRTWTDTELVTAAIMNPHIRDNLNAVPNVIPKTADQSVTSSTVLIDDTHLQFAIGASEAWEWHMTLAETGPGGLKVAFNAPSGATGWWSVYFTTSAADVISGHQIPATFVDGETQSQVIDPNLWVLRGFVLNSSTAGTFKLRWAQSSSNGTATIIKRGSLLERRKV